MQDLADSMVQYSTHGAQVPGEDNPTGILVGSLVGLRTGWVLEHPVQVGVRGGGAHSNPGQRSMVTRSWDSGGKAGLAGQPRAARRAARASAAAAAALALDVAGALAASPAAAAAPAPTLSAASPGEAAATAGATAAARAAAATARTAAATAGGRGCRCGCGRRTGSGALGRTLGKTFGGSRALLGGHGGAQLLRVNLEDKKPFTCLQAFSPQQLNSRL